MIKKIYSAPEVEVEIFSITSNVMTLSGDLDNNGIEVDTPGIDQDWEF